MLLTLIAILKSNANLISAVTQLAAAGFLI
ncbi:hypothetical protein VPHD184_0057 [Vibrio phage D184]